MGLLLGLKRPFLLKIRFSGGLQELLKYDEGLTQLADTPPVVDRSMGRLALKPLVDPDDSNPDPVL